MTSWLVASMAIACGDQRPPPVVPRDPVACEPVAAPLVCEAIGEAPTPPSVTGRVRALYPGRWVRLGEPDDPADLDLREQLAIDVTRVDGRTSHFLSERAWVVDLVEHLEADGLYHGDVDACLDAIGVDTSPVLDHPPPDAAP